MLPNAKSAPLNKLIAYSRYLTSEEQELSYVPSTRQRQTMTTEVPHFE